MIPDRRQRWCRMIFMSVVLGSAWGTYLLEAAIRPQGSYPLYILAAIPFFFVQIFAEWMLVRWDAAPRSDAATYECEDVWSSVSSGVVQLVWRHVAVRMFVTTGGFAFCQAQFNALMSLVFRTTWDSTRAWNVSDGWWVVPLAIVLKDVEYYTFHRMAHEYAWLWAGHSVHHSGDTFNLATALRQSWQQSLISPFFYAVTWGAFTPTVFATANDVGTLYQFWVHTCVVRRMGWMEWIFVTPSHHRVHHDRRVHKNFGGVFIVWDRLFGTFLDEGQTTETYDTTDEGEKCVFGVRDGGAASHHPRFVRFVDPVAQLRLGFFARTWRGPGYLSSTSKRVLTGIPWNDPSRRRLRGSLDRWGKVYIVAHFVTSAVHLIALLTHQSLTLEEVVSRGCAIVASLVVQGLIVDGYRWAWEVEALRLCMMVTLLRDTIRVSQTVAVFTIALYSASVVAIVPRLIK